MENSALIDSANGAAEGLIGRWRRRRPLRAIAGIIVTASLVYAPFAFGSVPPFAIKQLNIALAVATGFWLADCLLTWHKPRVSWIVAATGVIALSIGWFMAWNSRSVFAQRGSFIIRYALPPHRPHLPGGIEILTAGLTMVRLDALFGALLVTSDLGRDSVWRYRWAQAVACTGAAIAAFGIAQQAGFITFVATRMNQMEGEYFSTFNYHGNAGAYMNLALPVSAALCLYSFRARLPAAHRCAYAALAAAVLAGILANASRGAQAISALLLIGMGSAAAPLVVSPKSWLSRHRRTAWPIVVVFLIAVLGAGALHSARNEQRWRELPSELAKNSSRWQVWRVTAPMARSAGPFGHGPGSFKLLLPTSPLLSDALTSRWVLQTQILPGAQISMWSMAHDDYLQTWVEFGWVGLALAVIVLFGGVGAGIRRVSQILKRSSSVDGYILFGACAALLGVCTHALFDFPLQVESIQVTTVVLLGVCWSSRGWEDLKLKHSGEGADV